MAENFCNHCDSDNEHQLCTGLLDEDDPRCSDGVLQCACTCRTAVENAVIGYDGAGRDVNHLAAGEAVEAFAELWGTALFDCGPQDYKWMAEQILSRKAQTPAGEQKEKTQS